MSFYDNLKILECLNAHRSQLTVRSKANKKLLHKSMMSTFLEMFRGYKSMYDTTGFYWQIKLEFRSCKQVEWGYTQVELVCNG